MLLRDRHNQRQLQNMHPDHRSSLTTMYHPINSKGYRGSSTSRPSSRDAIHRRQSLPGKFDYVQGTDGRECQRRRRSLPVKLGNVHEEPQQQQQQNMQPTRRSPVAPKTLSLKTNDGLSGCSTSRPSGRDITQRRQSLPDKIDYVQDTHWRKQCQRRRHSLTGKLGNAQEAMPQQKQQRQQQPNQQQSMLHQPKQQLSTQQQHLSSWYSNRRSSESPHPM